MRTLSCWLGLVLLLMTSLAGCSQNTGYGNPFAPQSFNSSSPFGAPVAASSPSQQVAQLESWRANAAKQYQKMESQVAALTKRNEQLDAQLKNSLQHAKLQDEHLVGVNNRLKSASDKLAKTETHDQAGQRNIQSLDRINQEKERQLAGARQDVQRLEAQLSKANAGRDKAVAQLNRVETEKLNAERRAETLLATSRRRGGAAIRPNTNLSLPNVQIEGVDVRRDGDVVRISLPTETLFQPGTVQWRPNAAVLLQRVTSELGRVYPNQRMGIEGHTDSSTNPGGPWHDGHHYSSAQAMAVYQFVTKQSLLGRDQLHVVGHGSNYPVYSSATEAGRRSNQRVELVVYPETLR